MSQDFRPHPVLNYEASRDGVIRNRRLKKPLKGMYKSQGYLMFGAGNKKFFVHRTTYECFYGLIKDGLVIDHKNGVKTDNCLENLQAISQSENTKNGRTGTCKSVGKRQVKSFDTETNEEKIFQSMNAAGKDFDICRASVQRAAEKNYQTALSKKNGHKIKFSYIKGDNSYNNKVA